MRLTAEEHALRVVVVDIENVLKARVNHPQDDDYLDGKLLKCADELESALKTWRFERFCHHMGMKFG